MRTKQIANQCSRREARYGINACRRRLRREHSLQRAQTEEKNSASPLASISVEMSGEQDRESTREPNAVPEQNESREEMPRA
ncbi:MAG: hypothetical protein ABR577_08240 [Pyrinomonadaceae bacterium]